MKKNKNKFYAVSEDYYAALGLTSNASQNEIRKAFELSAPISDSESVRNLNKLQKSLKEAEDLYDMIKAPEAQEQAQKDMETIRANIAEIENNIEKTKDPKVVDAYFVLTNYKEEYDKDRAKYLKEEAKRADEQSRKYDRKIFVARRKAKKAEEKARRMDINTSVDYDAILGVGSTASTDEILTAHKTALSQNGVDIDQMTEAYKVLSSGKKNKAYHNARAQSVVYDSYKKSAENAQLIKRIEEEGYKPNLLSKKAKIIIGGTGVAILAAVIITGTVGLTKHFIKNSKNDSKGQTTIENNNDSVDNEILGNIANIESLINIGNLAQMFQNVLNGVVDFDNYYAFPSVTIVTEKAEQLQTSLNNAGLVNIKTGLPYEKEELKNIIQYMNGLYVPESEQDIYDMYTAYIDFVCTLACSEDLCYQINYAGGEKSFKEHIEERAKNPMFIDFVEAANLNDSYGIEYAKWLQDKFYTMLYTTDPKTYNALYNEVWQSFADIIVGNGATFTLDGETYKVTEDALLTKGNTGVASLVTLYLSNLQQPNKQVAINKKFYVKQQYLSANESEQDTYITIDQMINYINPYCEIDDANDKVTKPYNGQTWGERLQSNMKAIAYEQFMQTQEENYSLSFK